MENDLGNSIKLTKEETEELYAIREPTATELVILATEADVDVEMAHDADGIARVVIKSSPGAFQIWNPRYSLEQSHLLLAAVIAKGDCRLFYDDGVHEFFIYQYKYAQHSDGPPLAHQYGLTDTVFEAAMNLWCSEEDK